MLNDSKADLEKRLQKEISVMAANENAAAEAMIKLAPQLAKMRKVLFDSYVAAGFTVEQALALCVK